MTRHRWLYSDNFHYNIRLNFMAKHFRKIVAGLDIGSSKISAVVASITDDSSAVEILGSAIVPSKGIKNGMVVNIGSCVDAISRAIENAELMADTEIQSVFVGLSGQCIESINSQGITPIRSGEVTEADILSVIDAAKSISLSSDRKVMHVLPQFFFVDEKHRVSNPAGMAASRLKADVHLITCLSSVYHNIEKCVSRSKLNIDGLVLEQWALSHSLLSDQDREMGVCLVDIGAETTDIAVFCDGALKFCTSLDIAGDHITNDIALAMRSNSVVAEQIKQKHGKALAQIASPDIEISLPSEAHKYGASFSERMLAEVMEPRYEELLMKVQKVLRDSGHEDDLTLGLVLSGGGSKTPGLLDLAEDVFHMPVRIGLAKNISGEPDASTDPVYSTATALAQYGLRQSVSKAGKTAKYEETVEMDIEPQPHEHEDSPNIFFKAKHWVETNL
jgi:cell division protein FtsA